MNQRSENSGRLFVPDGESAEVLRSRMTPLDDPPALISAQLPPILMRGRAIGDASRDDWLNASLDQQQANGIALIAPVINESLRFASAPTHFHAHLVEPRVEQRDFGRGSRFQVYSERRTRAIGQYHKLCSLADFSLPHQRTPFSPG